MTIKFLASRLRFIYYASAVASLLYSAAAADYLVDDFEAADAPAPWTFWNGAEFPGATGSLTTAIGYGNTGKCAHLAFQMGDSGNYVSATRTLSTIAKGEKAIAFWARSPFGVSIGVRLVDSTNQTLQYNTIRPLLASDTAAWFRLTADFAVGNNNHWGGANDGLVHGGVRSVAILAEPAKIGTDSLGRRLYLTKSGAVEFDNVTLLDSIGETISPFAAASALPAAGNLTGKLGANIHFTKDSRALDVLHSAGFTWVRMDLGWMRVEATKGVYDFSSYDTLVAQLAGRSMKAHFIFDYSNTLYAGVTTDKTGPVTPEAMKGFCDFAKAAAIHFGSAATSYEIWNEPNIGFWEPSPNAADYSALARRAIDSIHAGNPNAKVSTAGLSGVDFKYLESCLLAGAGDRADGIGVHPYRQGDPESAVEDIGMFRQAVKAHIPSNTPPVWQTEWGYSSTWYGSGTADSSRNIQAKLALREMLTSWILGFPFMIYYDVRDDGTDPLNAEDNFGLLANDYSDKPVMQAVRTLTAQVSGRTLSGIIPTQLSFMHCLKLDEAQKVTLVLWRDNGFGGSYTGTVSKVPVTLQVQPLSVTDLFGNALAVPALQGGVCSLLVGTEPVYVTFSKGLRVVPGRGRATLTSVKYPKKQVSSSESRLRPGDIRYNLNGARVGGDKISGVPIVLPAGVTVSK